MKYDVNYDKGRGQLKATKLLSLSVVYLEPVASDVG